MLIKPSKQTSSTTNNGQRRIILFINVMTFATIASHSRRHAVRAFSSSSVTVGLLPHHHRSSSSSIAAGNGYPLGTALLSAKRGESRRFSTAASDRELEVALDDLLNNNGSSLY